MKRHESEADDSTGSPRRRETFDDSLSESSTSATKEDFSNLAKVQCY